MLKKYLVIIISGRLSPAGIGEVVLDNDLISPGAVMISISFFDFEFHKISKNCVVNSKNF